MYGQRRLNRLFNKRGWLAVPLFYFASGSNWTIHGQATADVSFQSYLTNSERGSGREANGLILAFRDFIPGFGLLSGNIAGGLSDGSGAPGRNYLTLEGKRWLHKKINITVGDFEIPASPIVYDVPGVTLPNFMATGVSAVILDETRTYNFFAGEGYLMQGPRISFRTSTRQNLLGSSAKWRLGPRLTLGVRLTRLSLDNSTTDRSVAGLFDPVSRSFQSSSNATFQARWALKENLELFGEIAATRSEKTAAAAGAILQPFSAETGFAWRSKSYTVRAVYLNQSADYLPLAGFYLGGRKGETGEVRVRPFAWLDLFAGGSHLESTTSLTAGVTRELSNAYSFGISTVLPGKITATTSFSSIDVFALPIGGGRLKSVSNSMAMVGLSKGFKRQTFRISFSDLDITTIGGQQKQRSLDFEDDVRFKWGSVGGAARWQNQLEGGATNNVAFRGFGNVNFRHINLYGSFEKGSDLVNRSLLARSAISTSTFGARGKIGKQWDVYLDAFRTRLLLNVNSENAFALANQGVLPSFLFVNDHWTLFTNVTKHFSWKGGDISGDLSSYTAKQLPITGKIEGIVSALHGAQNRTGVKGIPVQIDHDRIEYTDAAGHYRFADVSEGRHTLELDLRRLPVEFDFATAENTFADVRATRPVRVDFEVNHLVKIDGSIETTAGAPLAGVTVRLEPGGFSTLTEADGKFCFDNLVEKAYVVSARGVNAQVSLSDGVQDLLKLSIPEEIKVIPVRKIMLDNNQEPGVK